eukprot:c339_g1_i1.p1 GENE.c339_g1_i1~~c339_g1_i1.p1  ORF type:complete len:262 (+),score=45.30 c339_g1_i1:46-831(+)
MDGLARDMESAFSASRQPQPENMGADDDNMEWLQFPAIHTPPWKLRQRSAIEQMDRDASRCSAPNEIIPNLFLGSKSDAIQVVYGGNSFGIHRLLNVSDRSMYPMVYDNLCIQHLPMNDFGQTSLSYEFLARCFDFVLQGLHSGERVLVHCELGVNRSVTVVTCLLMCISYPSRSLDEVLAHVQVCRPMALPVPKYLAQLRQWEAGLAANQIIIPPHWCLAQPHQQQQQQLPYNQIVLPAERVPTSEDVCTPPPYRKSDDY